MGVIRTYNEMDWNAIDRIQTRSNQGFLHLFETKVSVVLLKTVSHRDLIVPLTRFERLRLRMKIPFGTITPVFGHVSTDVINVLLPIGATDDVDTKFAVLTVAIHIVII